MEQTAVEGGYALVPVPALAHVLRLAREKVLTGFDLRVFIALIELKDIRDAENARRKLSGAKELDCVRFSMGEIKRLLGGSSEALIRGALRKLKRLSVADFSARAIVFHLPDKPCSFLSSRRKLPAPRRILRFLAKENKKSLILTAISYLVRGLFSKKGVISASGRAKICLIRQLTGLSRGSVQRGRRILISMGVISADTESVQWSLNRHGSYFEVNLSFISPYEVSNPKNEGVLRPLGVKNEAVLRPPIKRLKPSKEANKPETLDSKPLAGALTSKGDPCLKNIDINQIRRGPSLIALYKQAVKEGWFQDSRMNKINFVASAIKAVRKSKTPEKLFIWTIKNEFKYLSNSDEDKALAVLAKMNAQSPQGFY